MIKISENEKILLSYLVINGEFYHLTEGELLDYISLNFPKPISRRTLYNYKRMIYDNYSLFPSIKSEKRNENGLPNHIKVKSTYHLHNRKRLGVFSLLRAKSDLSKKAEERNIPLEDFDKLNFIPSIFESQYIRSILTFPESLLLLQLVFYIVHSVPVAFYLLQLI